MDAPLSDVTKVPEDPSLTAQSLVPTTEPKEKAMREETLVPFDGEPSPIHRTIHYSIHTTLDKDISIEDDEMLEMQIQLGEVQERNLKRKIEHKRRKAEASLSSEGFDLSRELSMEIDRDLAKKHRDMQAHCKNLENELAFLKTRTDTQVKNHVEAVQREAKAELQMLVAQHADRLKTEYEARATQEEMQMAEQLHAQYKHELEVIQDNKVQMTKSLKDEHERELQLTITQNNHDILSAESRFMESQKAMQRHIEHEAECVERLKTAQYSAEFDSLRAELAQRNQELWSSEQWNQRLVADRTHMEAWQQEESAKFANAELATSSSRPNFEANHLRSQMENLREGHSAQMKAASARIYELDVRLAKLSEEKEAEYEKKRKELQDKFDHIYELNIEKCRKFHEDRFTQYVESRDASETKLREGYEAKIKELEANMEDMKISHFNEVDLLSSIHKNEMAKITYDFKDVRECLSTQVKLLSEEIQSLKKEFSDPPTVNLRESKDHRSSSTSKDKPSKEQKEKTKKQKDEPEDYPDDDPYYDPWDGDDWGEGWHEEGGEEEELEDDPTVDYGDDDYDYDGAKGVGGFDDDDDGDDYEEKDDIRSSGESKGLESVFKMLVKVMKDAGKKKPTSSSKEADTIKLPALPTPAQFKAWKNAVRSKVSSASKDPKEAFDWIMKVEDADATYEKLNDTPKKFETLDAKLTAALTELCKGELGRKVTLKTEEEAKARRLIRGRQILWMIYEEFRINEEAGSLNDITDLMKVVLRKDQSKIDHLAKFMMNWETILAGMKEPPPDTTLQVMLYDQVKHVPSLSADIAIYDRAASGSTDRSYQFLVKSINRIIEKTKQERNRKDIEKSLDNMNANTSNNPNITPFKKGKGKGKGKGGGGKGKGNGKPQNDGNCRQWMADQTCSRGASCTYKHPVINGWHFKAGAKAKAKPGGKKGGGKGKGNGKGNPKGKGKGEKQPCKYHAAGYCKFGDNCNMTHDAPTVAPVENAKPKKQPKAKAKSDNSEGAASGN